jgi:hypothetical protein
MKSSYRGKWGLRVDCRHPPQGLPSTRAQEQRSGRALLADDLHEPCGGEEGIAADHLK